MTNEIYLIMNKPAGFVCSALSDSHKTVYQLLTPELQNLVQNARRGHRLHTIGRLDFDTKGLLLFTTDGMFSHKIAAQKNQSGTAKAVSKTYLAALTKSLSPVDQKEYIEKAKNGILLPAEKKAGEEKAAPAFIHFINDALCEITLYEGKFHEVHRIFRALNNQVSELTRIAIGKLKLPRDLQEGSYRALSKEELTLINSDLR